MIHSIDPRSGTHRAFQISETSEVETDNILSDARLAFEVLRRTAPSTRIELLNALADAVEVAAPELVAVARDETALGVDRLHGEVVRTVTQLRLFATVVADGSYREVIIDDATGGSGGPELRRWLEPLGPVLVFAASNFPFAFSVLGGDSASALACGCPVVVKAHDAHPELSSRVAQLAQQVVDGLRLPSGTFSVVFGEQAGLRALRSPIVKACGFTGSTTGGRYLHDVAAQRPDPIPFFGELGSVNPVIVSRAAAHARPAEIAKGFVASFTLGGGQFCTKPGLLFLPAGHGLEPLLASEVGAVGPVALLTGKIAEAARRARLSLADDPDLDVVGTVNSETGIEHGSEVRAALFTTTAARVIRRPPLISEEYFGPISIIVTYQDPSELFEALENVSGSLTMALHLESEDAEDYSPLFEALSTRANRLLVNDWPTGVAVTWATSHGGPWPATTAVGHTSVGATSIRRWQRPVCYQSVPELLLPEGLRGGNPWNLPRRVNGTVHSDGGQR